MNFNIIIWVQAPTYTGFRQNLKREDGPIRGVVCRRGIQTFHTQCFYQKHKLKLLHLMSDNNFFLSLKSAWNKEQVIIFS